MPCTERSSPAAASSEHVSKPGVPQAASHLPGLVQCAHDGDLTSRLPTDTATPVLPQDIHHVFHLAALSLCRLGNGINWKSQVFTQMRNWTPVNNMTGVGNALKRHYQAHSGTTCMRRRLGCAVFLREDNPASVASDIASCSVAANAAFAEL